MLAHTPEVNYSGQGAVYFHSLCGSIISLETLTLKDAELKLKGFLSTALQNRTINLGGAEKGGDVFLCFPGSVMSLRAVYTAVCWCSLIFHVSGTSELCAVKYQQKQNLNCKNTALNSVCHCFSSKFTTEFLRQNHCDTHSVVPKLT